MKTKTCHLLAGLAACLVMPLANASEGPAAKVDAAEMDAAVKAVPAGPAMPAIVVKKGDTLDKLITRHLKNSPFNQDILRKAVIQKNPAAFKDGKAQGLIVGSQLLWPTMADYRKVLVGAGVGVDGGGQAEEHAAPTGAPDPRRGWVRFP